MDGTSEGKSAVPSFRISSSVLSEPAMSACVGLSRLWTMVRLRVLRYARLWQLFIGCL